MGVQNTYIRRHEAMSARASEAYMTAATNFSNRHEVRRGKRGDVERRQLTV